MDDEKTLFEQQLDVINEEVAAIEEDKEKVLKGQKKAARRVRKHMSNISKLCKAGRKAVLEISQQD